MAFLLICSVALLLNSISTVNRHEIGKTDFELQMGGFYLGFKDKIEMNPDEPDTTPMSTHKDDTKAHGSEAISTHSSSNANQNGVSAQKRKWAYAFLVGGAGNGNIYLAGLASIIAAKHKLKQSGSTADVVVMVQMSSITSETKLKPYEEELLEKMDIRLVYIPKFAGPEFENFYSLMMEKFRILNMTEYSRVLYMDSDVYPLCNMDYLFELSDPLPAPHSDTAKFQLKENVIVSYKSEPASGGFFILKPNATDFELIQSLIIKYEMNALTLPYPHWDENRGWGQYITLPDYWRPVRRHFKSNTWNFHGSWADQGLLYYWTKYIKKSVSIVVGPEVEQWSPDNWEEGKGEDDQLVLRTREDGSITTVVTDPLRNYSCGMPRGFFTEPYTEFFHMTGRNKPWYKSRERLEGLEKEKDLYGQWYGSLKEALIAVDSMDTFPWDDLFTRGGSLGSAPLYNEIAKYLKAKEQRNWNQY